MSLLLIPLVHYFQFIQSNQKGLLFPFYLYTFIILYITHPFLLSFILHPCPYFHYSLIQAYHKGYSIFKCLSLHCHPVSISSPNMGLSTIIHIPIHLSFILCLFPPPPPPLSYWIDLLQSASSPFTCFISSSG